MEENEKSLFKFLIFITYLYIIKAQTIKSVTRTTSSNIVELAICGNIWQVCSSLSAYSDGPCKCKCNYGRVFIMQDKKCNKLKLNPSYTISNGVVNLENLVPKLTSSQLQAGIDIQYCTSVCTRNTGDCKIVREQSYIDQENRVPLWSFTEDMDFSIKKTDTVNKLQLMNATEKYNGLLLNIHISCLLPDNTMVRQNAMFENQGTFTVPASTTTTTTTSTTSTTTLEPITTSTTTSPTVVSITANTTVLSTTSNTTIASTSTKPTAASTTTKKAVASTTTTPTVVSTVTKPTIVSNTTTQSVTKATVSTVSKTIPSSLNISTTAGSSTKTTFQSNTTINTNKPTKTNDETLSTTTQTTLTTPLVIVTAASKSQTGSSGKDEYMLIIIVPISFAILFALCCLLCVCCKSKRDEKSRKRPSEPVSLFQPTTPVFLVSNGDRQTMRAARNFESPFSMINDPLYELPPEGKKGGTVRGLYAQIDKFLKKKKRSSIDGSLDDGYITDDNYDYRRFAAFPSDMYSFPGSTISLNEPDYRIPEDIDTVQIHQQRPPPYSSYHHTAESVFKTQNSNYATPKKKSSLKKKKVFDDTCYDTNSYYERPDFNSLTKLKIDDNTLSIKKKRSFFIDVDDKNTSESDSDEHPYDEVGEVLKNKRISFLQQESSMESIYDDPDIVIVNRKRDVSLKYSKPNKKNKKLANDNMSNSSAGTNDGLYSKDKEKQLNSFDDETPI